MNVRLKSLYKNTWFRALARPLIKPVRPISWVFLLGCYNSGTTLLDHLIALHPEISNLPSEGVALTDQLPVPEDFGWPRLWYKCRGEIEASFSAYPAYPERVRKDWSLYYDRNAYVLVEKSVANVLRISWLNEHFTNPVFVWIIRNGYCVAEGIRRRSAHATMIPEEFRDKGYPIEWCIRQWVECNRLIEEATKNMDNVVRLTYEDLVAEPQCELSKILDYLPLKDPDPPFPEDFTFHGETNAVQNMNYNSLSRLSNKDIYRINQTAALELEYWGYQIMKSA